MKRSKSLIKLSHEHNAGLMLALGLKKNAPALKSIPGELEAKAEYALKFYHDELIHHFKEEEEILFPFISGKYEEIDKMIPSLLSEHQKIHRMFNEINLNNVDAEHLAEIGELLRTHIRKEERHLFEYIQQHYSDEELENILSKHS